MKEGYLYMVLRVGFTGFELYSLVECVKDDKDNTYLCWDGYSHWWLSETCVLEIGKI